MHNDRKNLAEVLLCNSCAVGVVNCDWTHLDADVNSATEEEFNANHGATLAAAELIVSVDIDSFAATVGIVDCSVCGAHTFGAHTGLAHAD